MKKSLYVAIKHLLETKPLFAHFVMNSQVMWDVRGVSTAGAGVFNLTPTLIFNSEFVSKLTVAEFSGVVEHEVKHLLFRHLTLAKDSNLDHSIYNIATDWVINQYIKILPKGCIFHEEMEKKLGVSVERNQSSFFYYNLLLQNKDKVKGMLPMDVHDLEEILGKEDTPEAVKIAIKDALGKALKGSAGQIPSEMTGVVSELNKPESIPWKQVLRNFIASSVNSSRIPTRKKMNRRFGLDIPGFKKKRELVLGICRDTSGSVSDDLFSGFINETSFIIKNNVAKAFLIDADCEITNIEVVKGKDRKLSMKRNGYGGTAYQPAITKCKELKCDAIIYMGDGDSADVPLDPGIPFLWVLPDGCTPPADFGKVLRIN